MPMTSQYPILPGYLFQNNRAHGIRLSRLRKLQEALYLACEHGYLSIALELRSIGVMWNLNFWTRLVYLGSQVYKSLHLPRKFKNICLKTVYFYKLKYACSSLIHGSKCWNHYLESLFKIIGILKFNSSRILRNKSEI